MKIKVLFLGTSDFSAKCLQHLLQDSQFSILAVITKPAIASDRGMKLQLSPVHVLAQERNIKVFTPSSFQNKNDIKNVQSLDIDVVVVVAYGLILPAYFLNWFAHRVVNIHTSLLPRWRGAAPVSQCLLAGDKKTGVTLQKVIPKLDAGDIIHQLEFPLLPAMDSQDVIRKMEPLSFQLLSHFLPLYLKGDIQPTSQDESQVTYAKKIKKSQLELDWSKSAYDIFTQIQALVIHSGSYTFYQGKRIKIFQSSWEKKDDIRAPGTILSYNLSKGLQVSCGQGSLYLKEVQLEGKRRQNIQEFIRGFELKIGNQFEK